MTDAFGMLSHSQQLDVSKALQIADERMYKGKFSGKNKLVYD